MTVWDALQTLCLAVGYVSVVLFVILVCGALIVELREWLEDQDRRHLIDRARRLEDLQVAALDDLWHMPTREPR